MAIIESVFYPISKKEICCFLKKNLSSKVLLTQKEGKTGNCNFIFIKNFCRKTKVENKGSFVLISLIQGYRTYVASTYIGFNVVGFAINAWVLYVVAPLLFAPAIKVPKSILFYIFALCVGDLMTMIGIKS